MIYTDEQIRKLRRETVAAIVDFYSDEGPPPGEVGWEAHAQKERDARTMVTRALNPDTGIAMRQLAGDTRLSGLLIIRLIDDPQVRADAFAAELYHLERALGDVRRARAHDARDRYRQGQQEKGIKVRLAESYGVTRPTLDAWLTPDEQEIHDVDGQ